MESCVDCLIPVIGISENDCVCFDDGRQASFSESLSGLFMDNATYGLPLTFPQRVVDCGDNDLWTLSDRMRREGIQQFVSDYNRAILASRYVRLARPWTGNIGDVNTDGNLDVDNIHGVIIDGQRYRGVSMRIHQVRILVDPTSMIFGARVNVFLTNDTDIADGTPPEQIADGTFNLNGVLMVQLLDVTLPMIDASGLPIRWYVYAVSDDYTRVQDTPMAVKKSGCCGSKRVQHLETTNGWVNAVGFQVDDIKNVENATTDTKKSFGLHLNVSLNCTTTWMCQPFDWCNDDWGRVVAEMLVLYANRSLANYMLMTDRANIYTAARSDELLEKRDMIQSWIDERMPFLVEQLPHGASDCYSCRSSRRKSAILV